MILFVLLVILVATLVLRPLCICKKGLACTNKIKNWLMWNPIIRCTIELYFDALFSAALNIKSVMFELILYN